MWGYFFMAAKMNKAPSPEISQKVGALLESAFAELPPDIDALLPVPLHWQRHAVRGFNQAREIARSIARTTGLPLLHGKVLRERATAEQTGLGRAARRRNVRGAFVVKDDLPFEHVAIVDDVCTTGSTAGELARTLRRAGVGRISLWTVARAGLTGVL